MHHYANTRYAPDIQPNAFRWLWPTRIPLGSVTVLAGDPGVGKSLLAATLAAHVSTARTFPDGYTCAPWPEPNSPAFSGGVIYLSAEDHPASILIPRLKRAGAALDRINILDGVIDRETYLAKVQLLKRQRAAEEAISFPDTDPDTPQLEREASKEPMPLTLPTHHQELAQAIRSISHPRLLVIDTLPAILDPGPVSLAQVMRMLNELAHCYHISILALMHLAKTRTHRPIYRVRGSLTYTAAARTVLLISADADDPDQRTLVTLKSVYARPAPPLTFRIGCHCDGCHADGSCVGMSSPAAGIIHWNEPAAGSDLPSPASLVGEGRAPRSTDSSLSADLYDLSSDSQSALNDAVQFLERELAEGPRPARTLIQQAKSLGLYPITLRRAKRLLRVRSEKEDLSGGWIWSVPTSVQIKTCPARTPPEGDQQNCHNTGPQ